MTIKYVEKLYCDRCKELFTRRGPGGEYKWLTSYFGIFILDNGSGSRYNPKREGRGFGARKELDQDMCNQCTVEFRQWWKEGKKDNDQED